MNVTAEQLEALKHGAAVNVNVEHEECILILKSAYEELQQQSIDPRISYAAVIQVWNADGSDEDAQLYSQ